MTVSTNTPIVFTDLDGTLLDHDDYSVAGAEEALEYLRQRAIPLVFCSSKTAAEIVPLRAELGFTHCPAIVENGAGLLAALLPELRANFSGFSEWTLETLADRTGLDPESAALAARRDFSEPGLWRGDTESLGRFTDELERHGVRAQRGGRFLTLGFAADKVDRMRELLRQHRAQHGDDAPCIALGDAPNDVAMLRAADIGIIVPNPAHAGIPPLPEERTGRIRRAGQPGPRGWAESLLLSIDIRDATPGGSYHG